VFSTYIVDNNIEKCNANYAKCNYSRLNGDFDNMLLENTECQYCCHSVVTLIQCRKYRLRRIPVSPRPKSAVLSAANCIWSAGTSFECMSCWTTPFQLWWQPWASLQHGRHSGGCEAIQLHNLLTIIGPTHSHSHLHHDTSHQIPLSCW